MAIVEADQETIEALHLELQPDRTERLWAKGSWMHFAVYKVQADALQLNPRNRRFRAEREEIERELGRALDPQQPEDQSALISLVLDKEPRLNERGQVVGKRNPDTDALREDWRQRDQESPFWIRPNGLIVNGNRRWAMLRRLHEDEAFDRFEYVDVIVLGSEFDDRELFRLEASEQMTEGLKVRYGDVNLLLTLREAAELEGINWYSPRDVDRVAELIKHLVRNDKRRAVIQLMAVFYMAEYLKLIGAEGEFRRMERRVERFRDVANNMAKVRALDRDREYEMLACSFAAVRAGNAHEDLREIRRIFEKQPELFDELHGKIKAAVEELGGIQPEPRPQTPAWTDEDDEDEDEDDELVVDPEAYAPLRQLISVEVQAARTTRESQAKSVRLASALLDQVTGDELRAVLEMDDDGQTREAVERIAAWSAAAAEQLGELRQAE